LTSEAEIQQQIRLRLGRSQGLTLWRNSTGVSQHTDRSGRKRFERHGLVRGASDLIGILSPSGRWFALEIKSATGRPTEEQLMFLALIRNHGGFGAVVRSVEEAEAALARAKGGLSE
jgi:hypothetical protein